MQSQPWLRQRPAPGFSMTLILITWWHTPGVFFIPCCCDETHGRRISRSVSTLQWAINTCYCFLPLCLSPRNYVWPPVWKPVHVQRGCIPCEPSPNHQPQLRLDCSACRDGLCQLHVRIHTEPWADTHSGDDGTIQPTHTVWIKESEYTARCRLQFEVRILSSSWLKCFYAYWDFLFSRHVGSLAFKRNGFLVINHIIP